MAKIIVKDQVFPAAKQNVTCGKTESFVWAWNSLAFMMLKPHLCAAKPYLYAAKTLLFDRHKCLPSQTQVSVMTDTSPCHTEHKCLSGA